jgi:hypothetical protein
MAGCDTGMAAITQLRPQYSVLAGNGINVKTVREARWWSWADFVTADADCADGTALKSLKVEEG